ncbi:hypothetical protein [Streptacidiphilus cavernicola]|uniref:Uncharacterized protein n=1 Tax=Streptacidiphilus cavernicola TaxID=3342716 RepID=A0ABV6W448_9ACTN
MNTTREIGTAVTTRALVRITEGNGHHKGVAGIALGYNAQYDSIKVGFIDASGNYTGDYTTVAVQHVEVVESAPEATHTATEATPEPTASTAASAHRQKSTRTARRNKAAAILRHRAATTRATARIRRNTATRPTFALAA